MTREYKILFKVAIKHDFYQSGQSKDFEFVPTGECVRLMENHDLLFRNNGSGFFVAFKKTNGQVQRPIGGPLRLAFLMKLKNPSFERFTNLGTGTPALGNRGFYFTNLSETGDIDLTTELAVVGGAVSDSDKATLAPANLSIPTFNSNSISIFTYKVGVGEENVFTESIAGMQSIRLSLKGFPAGFYGLRWLGPPSTSRLYFDPDNRPGFGVVEIFKDETLDYEALPVEYTLTFKRKEQFWSYYLMDKTSRFPPNPLTGFVPLTVNYTPSPGGVFPSAASFPQVLVGSQSVQEKALIASTAAGLGIQAEMISLFKSDIPLPSHELGGAKLKLLNGASTLLPPLPLPDMRSGSAEIFVNL